MAFMKKKYYNLFFVFYVLDLKIKHLHQFYPTIYSTI